MSEPISSRLVKGLLFYTAMALIIYVYVWALADGYRYVGR